MNIQDHEIVISLPIKIYSWLITVGVVLSALIIFGFGVTWTPEALFWFKLLISVSLISPLVEYHYKDRQRKKVIAAVEKEIQSIRNLCKLSLRKRRKTPRIRK